MENTIRDIGYHLQSCLLLVFEPLIQIKIVLKKSHWNAVTGGF